MLDLPLIKLLRDPTGLSSLDIEGWDATLTAARSTNLTGRIARQVEQRHLLAELPPEVRPHIVAALRLCEHQRHAVAWECAHLETALSRLNVPVVLLKGAAYAMSGRRAAHGRLFGDIDLLVPHASLNEVEAALMLRGWSVGSIDPYDNRYYRRWMHELPPMTHHERGTVVDIHHNILPLTARHVPNIAALLAQRVPVPSSSLFVLSPTDMVIHSAVHLFHEGQLRNGLRDLCDLYDLLTEFIEADPNFYRTLVNRALELGLAWPVGLALRYCRLILGTRIPPEIEAQARSRDAPGRLHQRLLDAAYLRALLPAYPPAVGAAIGMARLALYLRAHALRMTPARLTLHLCRKAVLRTFKNSSRTRAAA